MSSSLLHMSWLQGKSLPGPQFSEMLSFPLRGGGLLISENRSSKCRKHGNQPLLSVCCMPRTYFIVMRQGLSYFEIFFSVNAIRDLFYLTAFSISLCVTTGTYHRQCSLMVRTGGGRALASVMTRLKGQLYHFLSVCQ